MIQNPDAKYLVWAAIVPYGMITKKICERRMLVFFTYM